MNWRALTIAIVAGDRREQEIARQAVATGATVRAFGFPWPAEGIDGVSLVPGAAEALQGAPIALFPIPGIAADGALFAPQSASPIVPDHRMLAGMARPAHIILGWADANLRRHGAALGLTFHEYEKDEDLMLLRGPAIVEGLLKVIVENTDITLHKARVCIIGQGTIGFLVTRYMIALGAHTQVVARNAVQRAAAHAAGAESHEFADFAALAPALDVIVSTVPTLVVDRDILARLPKHALVVDLAAPPGGIDRDAAKSLGLRFVWARGLGSRAPVTVGRSQWIGIKRRIETIMGAAQ